MSKKRSQSGEALDTSSFEEKIREFIGGKVTIDNPTITDYIQHYGSKKELAIHYAEENGLKYDTARKQIERMMQKPDMKLRQETIDRLGKLTVQYSDKTIISITGWYTYDYSTFRWNTFSNERRPFTPEEMKEIVNATLKEGNDAGINKFLQLYGVDGLQVSFAKKDLDINIFNG